MRSITLLPALMGLTAAVPHNDAAGWFGKRADNKGTSTAAKCKTTPATACTSQPSGYGPTTSPDTVPNFMGHGQFSKAAAQAATPPNYVQAFQNQDGASSANQYITSYNFQSYDTNACAAKCDQVSDCVSFNLYFERVPTISTDPDCCPNPKSMTTIRCAIWGSALDKKSANNKGQWRNSFQVVIAGSNGYNKIGGTSTGSRATAPATTSSTKSSATAGSSSASSAVTPTASTSSTKSVMTAGSSPTSSAATAQDSSTISSATPSIAAAEKNFATTASSGTKSSSASSSTSKTYLSNTDEVQPITGTEPGSPITATADTSSASTGCATPIATPAITFNLNKTTVVGEDLFMYGSIDQLGNWQVEKSYPMSAFYYTVENTNWFATIDVPAGTYFEYKYFQRNQKDYSISWANPPNMRYTVPTGCEKLIVVNDQWPGTEDQTPA